ncbi:MAG: hypothetical protein ACTHLN_01350, partial [Tepidisphaeraceae bacterium]
MRIRTRGVNADDRETSVAPTRLGGGGEPGTKKRDFQADNGRFSGVTAVQREGKNRERFGSLAIRGMGNSP